MRAGEAVRSGNGRQLMLPRHMVEHRFARLVHVPVIAHRAAAAQRRL